MNTAFNTQDKFVICKDPDGSNVGENKFSATHLTIIFQDIIPLISIEVTYTIFII